MVTLAGVFCAMVTPLGATGRLDRPGLERLVRRVVEGGAQGISPVGSTGEAARLPAELRHEVVRLVRATVPAGYPVLPGVVTTVPAAVPDELRALGDLGADAALVPPPPNYLLEPPEIRSYFAALADASPVPLVLYHFPALFRQGVPAEVAADLAAHPNIIGLKDSSRDLEYSQQVRQRAPSGFAVLTGSDTLLLATLAIGGAGTIAASVNLVPQLGGAVYRAFEQHDITVARAEQDRLFDVVAACRSAGFPQGWKAALGLLGVCQPYPAAPAERVHGPTLARLRRRLAELGVQ